MDYWISESPETIPEMPQSPINEEIVASAIAGVVRMARAQGQSLADLTAQVLHEDGFLDHSQRLWLSDIVAEAWNNLP